jgi:hypothetical protein
MTSRTWSAARSLRSAGAGVLGVLLAASSLAACGGDAPAGTACASQLDCGANLVCLDGFCRDSVGIGEADGVTIPDLDALSPVDVVPGVDVSGVDGESDLASGDEDVDEEVTVVDVVTADAPDAPLGEDTTAPDDGGDPSDVPDDTVIPDDVADADVVDGDTSPDAVADVVEDVVEDADAGADADAGVDADAASDADGGSDADTIILNACGGTDDLAGEPGDTCSPCGGTLSCATENSLECVGDTTNACGGCDALDGEPGGSCGACGGGTLSCDGANDLSCADPGGLNACGGCSVLEGQPGEGCGVCGDGEWACDGLRAVECVGAGSLNACGGCSVLSGVLGAACGACGGGVQTCSESGESLLCVGAAAPNACGTCGPLAGPAGSPGGACGACGDGRLACNTAGNALTCQGASALNACGTCGPLSGTLGAACGDCGGGRLVCDSTGSALICEGGGVRNACGSCGTLTGAPGAACGTCSDGRFACNEAGTAVTCVGGSGLNACGACGVLTGTPGAACGVCGTLQCAGASAGADVTGLVCNDPGANACGGCGTVTPAAPGSACGRCNLDTLACSGANATTCGGNTTNTCGGCSALPNTVGAVCANRDCFGNTGRWTCSGANALSCDCNSQICGNGVLETDEECDDGNRINGDTCSNGCELNFPVDPDDLAGTCANPIVVPANQQFVWDLCDRGDQEDNIAGTQDCIDASSRGEDLVFQFTLTTRSTVRIDAFDSDGTTAIDPVIYLRRGTCSDASTQVICDDDVPCASGRPEFGGACFDGRQPRQASLTTILDAGTWFLVLDSYNYTRGSTQFTCGDTYLSIRSL